jgi:hypothetical protein
VTEYSASLVAASTLVVSDGRIVSLNRERVLYTIPSLDTRENAAEADTARLG